MQRVRFNLKFIHNVSNENFSLLVCYHRNDGGCVLWNFTWDGYHLPDSGVIRGDWAVRLSKHEEESSCWTGYSQRWSTTPDRWSSDLVMFLTGELVQCRRMMKKLVFLFLTLLIVGCGTTRKTVFFERVTPLNHLYKSSKAKTKRGFKKLLAEALPLLIDSKNGLIKKPELSPANLGRFNSILKQL